VRTPKPSVCHFSLSIWVRCKAASSSFPSRQVSFGEVAYRRFYGPNGTVGKNNLANISAAFTISYDAITTSYDAIPLFTG